MDLSRIKILNKIEKETFNSVVYVMSRDQRVKDNFALLYAQETANKLKLPLVVIFNLYKSVPNRTLNQFEWMLEGLKEVEQNLKFLNIEFFIVEHCSASNLAELIEQNFNPYSIFFDFSPLAGPTKFKEKFLKETKSSCVLVDTHNIIPVWQVSPKEEFAAYTLRPKIKKLLKKYLVKPESLTKHEYSFSLKIPNELIKDFNIDELLKKVEAENIENYQPVVKPGENAAEEELEDFIDNKLIEYFSLRNNPNENAQSNLSAYLHYGNLYSLTVANKVLDYCGKNNIEPEFGFKEEVKNFNELSDKMKLKLGAESFLEELIVRKELADNYCYYNKNYNSFEGLKDWAKKTLNEHKNDKREITYSLEQLESAKTSDAAWNAAQTQMLKTGKIHGYMRMYWAKKLLEWTQDPQTAIKYLIYLNDKYHLDGYDPNGYVGILWSIGGLHDRAWFERPIFGQIRYMNSNGLARKFDLEKYIQQWS
jgi:deoxyribodipyrimidine photo-lyase